MHFRMPATVPCWRRSNQSYLDHFSIINRINPSSTTTESQDLINLYNFARISILASLLSPLLRHRPLGLSTCLLNLSSCTASACPNSLTSDCSQASLAIYFYHSHHIHNCVLICSLWCSQPRQPHHRLLMGHNHPLLSTNNNFFWTHITHLQYKPCSPIENPVALPEALHNYFHIEASSLIPSGTTLITIFAQHSLW